VTPYLHIGQPCTVPAFGQLSGTAFGGDHVVVENENLLPRCGALEQSTVYLRVIQLRCGLVPSGGERVTLALDENGSIF